MKQFKQILIVGLFGMGLLLSTNLYSFQSNDSNPVVQQNDDKKEDKKSSDDDKKEDKKSGGKTRTYKPPKKDK